MESFYLGPFGMPGIALGIWFYTLSHVNLLRLLIGSMCLLFIFWQTLCNYGIAVKTQVRLPACVGILAGLAAGFYQLFKPCWGSPCSYIPIVGETKQNSVSGDNSFYLLDHQYWQGDTLLILSVIYLGKLNN